MHQGDLCNVYLMAKQNGSYTGTVSFPAPALSRRQFDEEDRQEDQRRMRGEDEEDEASRVDIRKMEAELKERAESLRRERELFELAKWDAFASFFGTVRHSRYEEGAEDGFQSCDTRVYHWTSKNLDGGGARGGDCGDEITPFQALLEVQ